MIFQESKLIKVDGTFFFPVRESFVDLVDDQDLFLGIVFLGSFDPRSQQVRPFFPLQF